MVCLNTASGSRSGSHGVNEAWAIFELHLEGGVSAEVKVAAVATVGADDIAQHKGVARLLHSTHCKFQGAENATAVKRISTWTFAALQA